jgi:hypothetical protein
MAMVLHAINQAVLVKSTDNSGNSCNMRVKCTNRTTKSPCPCSVNATFAADLRTERCAIVEAWHCESDPAGFGTFPYSVIPRKPNRWHGQLLQTLDALPHATRVATTFWNSPPKQVSLDQRNWFDSLANARISFRHRLLAKGSRVSKTMLVISFSGCHQRGLW